VFGIILIWYFNKFPLPKTIFVEKKSYLPLVSKSVWNGMGTLVWQDEFDGNVLNPIKWNVAEGSYDPDYHLIRNVSVSNGNLIITAKKEDMGVLHYTTGWITTKQNWTYGRFEARAKLPTGKGLWPAFWMLPVTNHYGTGVASGEIDIMELWGNRPSEIKGTLHYGWPWRFISTPFNLSSGDFSQNYHIFTVEWQNGVIRWYVDNKLYKKEDWWFTSGGTFPAPFDRPFYIVLNVGIWAQVPPDQSTVFPEQMIVDWVRVYQ